MRHRLLIASCAVLLFVSMCVIENRAVQSRPVEPPDNASAIYRLAGEFRVVFANLLWIKADKYHHEYIQHDPNWCNNKELLGLFNMIIALDPKFVEAYSSGTYILYYGYHNTAKALAYLENGISNNPKSMELNELAAVLYAYKLNDPERALPFAQRAVRYAADDFYRGVAKRTLHSIERMLKEKRR